MLSSAEENYVKAIYHLMGEEDRVGTNRLAERMHTKPASVSDMLRKLEAKGMLHYEKYYGCSLTDAGRQQALDIIRRHRLWEYFLAEKLGYGWAEVHAIAEQLEHVQAPELTSRLDHFLGQPRLDPHGDPIPDAAGGMPMTNGVPLSEWPVGKAGIIVRVHNLDSAILGAISTLGLAIGQRLQVDAVQPEAGFIAIRLANARLLVPGKMAEAIFLKAK